MGAFGAFFAVVFGFSGVALIVALAFAFSRGCSKLILSGPPTRVERPSRGLSGGPPGETDIQRTARLRNEREDYEREQVLSRLHWEARVAEEQQRQREEQRKRGGHGY